ncbi:MAG: ankyrin repeat domain-containing protein [Chlamydiales bacterium]|nr:ankyrin repeat domain-containing protein [Chlamydiales bacterium]
MEVTSDSTISKTVESNPTEEVSSETNYKPGYLERMSNTLMGFWVHYVLREDVNEELSKALQKRDIEEIEWNLRLGANPQITDENGNNILHIASSTKNIALAQLGLTHKVAIDVVNNEGVTPLQLSILSTKDHYDKQNKITQDMLKEVRDILFHDKGNFQKPASHLFFPASNQCSRRVIELMGNHYLSSKQFTKLSTTKQQFLLDNLLRQCIVNAYKSDNTEFLDLANKLLKKGANPSSFFSNKLKQTLLHYTKTHKLKRLSYALLKAGASLEVKDVRGRKPGE